MTPPSVVGTVLPSGALSTAIGPYLLDKADKAEWREDANWQAELPLD